MKQNLTVNLIPFRIVADGIDLYFSTNNSSGQKIKRLWVPSDIEVPTNEDGFTYWSLDEVPDSVLVRFSFFKKTADEQNRLHFSKRVLTQLLLRHFGKQQYIVGTSYVGDARVWVPAPETTNGKSFSFYDKFTLRVDVGAFKGRTGIFISYDGQSAVSSLKISDLDLPDISIVGKAILDNKIYSRKQDDFPESIEGAFPVFNKAIEQALGANVSKRHVQNKYKYYYEKVRGFYDSNLSDKSIENCLEVMTGGFLPVPEPSISRVDEGSNLLEFRNGVPNVNVYDGLKEAGGPFMSPDLSNLKILFVFMERDKELANRLYSYLNKGYRNFPGLEKYVAVPFDLDVDKSLRISNEDAIIDAVTNWLGRIDFDQAKRYFVFYISPISKDEEDEERFGQYYKIKELLLRQGIASQVIFKSNLEKSDFNFYLPNIAVAVLAKLGGIPWRLPYPIKQDLIIGVGAYRSPDTHSKLVGNAICFHNDGKFEEFNVFPASDIESLGNSIKESIKSFVSSVGQCNRVVVHYYKDLGSEERTILDRVMMDLNINMPYIFVNVSDTESRDYVVFDEAFDGKMPMSGTIIRLRAREFLLCNNTRYQINTGQRMQGYPFPVKLKIQSHPTELIDDYAAMRDIINQVYEFSRIYWKSIRQRNKPVTIEYSEIVAKMVSRFKDNELPGTEVATKTLWFL